LSEASSAREREREREREKERERAEGGMCRTFEAFCNKIHLKDAISVSQRRVVSQEKKESERKWSSCEASVKAAFILNEIRR